jgi:hypothetical protein
MEQFPPPLPTSSPTPFPPPPPSAAPPWQPAAMPPRPPTPNKAAWRIPAAIVVTAVAIGIGALAVVRTASSVRTAATTSTALVTSTSSTTASVTTIASIPPPGMTSLQFAGIKSVIKQIAALDISPYEDCIRQSPYTLQMTDATMLVCIYDPALRLQYIKAALDRSGLLASSPPEYIDCYEAAVVTDEFSARLANPVGVGEEANAWAIDQFTSAGLACSKPKS